MTSPAEPVVPLIEAPLLLTLPPSVTESVPPPMTAMLPNRSASGGRPGRAVAVHGDYAGRPVLSTDGAGVAAADDAGPVCNRERPTAAVADVEETAVVPGRTDAGHGRHTCRAGGIAEVTEATGDGATITDRECPAAGVADDNTVGSGTVQARHRQLRLRPSNLGHCRWCRRRHLCCN